MEKTETRELRTTQTFSAPIDLTWEVWTNSKHIANWWGPVGFTNTIHTMDFQEGGEWKLTMHGPDGQNFPNRSIFREIIPFKKIVFEHFNPHFFTTVLFESTDKKTMIDWSLLFDTAELYEVIVKAHKADEGQKQNMEKLQRYLMQLPDNSDLK
ncbi:SRPBCC domain-containing protein [Dyadobacter psychrotolerans]|uniref:Polyketide cyclase n=1 Tax=Dyadobacter psychrotolerans TaxID=2541721 RepID=A0A4R5DQA9_9BACT|nr:SRPBCC domain-containing protein [Dyadobacter psychrotolerans]TDE14414.1 polyketide cyclase [Dyadobacter psychrotolerans]